jgi:hypothetical protein
MPKYKTIPFEYQIDEKGCFNITSHKTNYFGYADFKYRGITKRIHRHVYEEMFGFIEDGLVVRHKCDNASCINPEHLEVGTQLDNIRDMYERGRSYSRIGENNSCARLTKTQVIEIKKSLITGTRGADLARKYGVTSSQINRIKKGAVWTSVIVDDEEKNKMQEKNERKNHFVTMDGETKTLKEWSEFFGIKYGTVTSRVSRGMSGVEALRKSLKRTRKEGNVNGF